MSGSFLILTRIAERGCRFLNEILKSCEECASPPVLLRRGHPGGAVFHCILALCNYCQVLLGFPRMAPQSKKNKQLHDQETPKQQKHDKTPLFATTPLPWRVQSCFFFVFAFPRIFGRKTKKQKTQETE